VHWARPRLVEGAPAVVPDADAARRVLEALMRELPLAQSVKLAAAITGARKNDVYELALSLDKGG
jgi:16S rRNA (cytidine1402-2'-O)-methyltransferase